MASHAHGVLVFGTRRVLPGRASTFREDFEAWVDGPEAAGLNAAFAFPDPADAERMHSVFWAPGDLVRAGPAASEAFAGTSDDPDTLDVYGQGRLLLGCHDDPAIRCNKNVALAGFVRAPHENGRASGLDDPRPPPMIGFFRRAIKPGRLEALADSFQDVCDIWHATIPGMLASLVTRDPEDENFVRDVRIFADGVAYAAHVDKSNEELTRAMELWFDNYDISVPHTGALFTVGDGNTSDPSTMSSSVKEKPVRLAFNQFHYGHGGMVGKPPELRGGQGV